MKKICDKLNTNNLIWFQGQVILIIIGVWLFLNNLMDLKIFVSSTLVVCLLFFAMTLNNFLYRWLNLELSKTSLVSFMIVVVMFSFYIKGFLTIYYGLPTPIYVQDLPLLSQYRYLLFSLGTLIVIILWFIGCFVKNLSSLYQKVTYPYIKEEVRKILYCWNEGFMGNICIFLYKKINKSKSFCILFFMCHFFVFYFIRLLTCVFFLCFTFFEGDFRFVIYVIPFLFSTWILSFFDYYFNVFREGTENYVKDMLSVTYDKSFNKQEDVLYIICNPEDLTFCLTAEGIFEGYNDPQSLAHLVNKWFSCSDVAVKFKIYLSYVSYFRTLLFIIYPMCWLTLAYKFLSSDVMLLTLWGTSSLCRRPMFNSKIFNMRLPRDARYVREGKPMNDVKMATNGAVSPGHPVIGEERPNDYLIIFGLTHGDGKAANTSRPIVGAPFKVIPVEGGPVPVNKNLLSTTPIVNTTALINRSDIEKQLDNKEYSRVQNDDS